jgi:hypothetical protein
MTGVLWNANAADVRAGSTPNLKWMSAPDTYRYFHKC